MSELRASAGAQADEVFTRLMIDHHAAGVAMADFAAAHGQNANVQRLAAAMAKVQRSEIAELNHRRTTLGFAPVDAKALEDLHADTRADQHRAKGFGRAGHAPEIVWVRSELMSDAVISVRGLRKRYGSHEAIKGIDLDVGQGEIFGLLGTNGAGKTTTIEILEGYRSRTAGEVSVLGVDPDSADAQRGASGSGSCSRRASSTRCTPCARPSACSPDTSRVRGTSTRRSPLSGLGENRTKRIGALSGGQKRRVDVALGLIGDPDLLFLDEPTTGFDPQARRDALEHDPWSSRSR